MALQSSDLLLVQRGTVSYQMPASQLTTSPEIALDLQTVTDKGNETTNDILLGDGNSTYLGLYADGQVTGEFLDLYRSADALAFFYGRSGGTRTTAIWSEGAVALGGNVGDTYVASTPHIGLNGVDGSASFSNGELTIESNALMSLGGVSTLKFTNTTSGTIGYEADGSGVLHIHDTQDDSNRASFKRSSVEFNSTNAEGGDAFALFETKGKFTIKGEAKIRLQALPSGDSFLSCNPGGNTSTTGLYVGVDTNNDEPKNFLFTNDNRFLIGGTLPTSPNIELESTGAGIFAGDVTTKNYFSSQGSQLATGGGVYTRRDGAIGNQSAMAVFDGSLNPVDMTFSVNWDGSATFKGEVFTSDGLKTDGYHSVGPQKERFDDLGSMTANPTLDLANGNLFYHSSPVGSGFSPNIINSNSTFGSYLGVGESVSIILTYVAAANTFPLNFLYIDGTQYTPYWMGGDAPTEGGVSGFDILTYQILRNSSGYIILASHNVTSG